MQEKLNLSLRRYYFPNFGKLVSFITKLVHLVEHFHLIINHFERGVNLNLTRCHAPTS